MLRGAGGDGGFFRRPAGAVWGMVFRSPARAGISRGAGQTRSLLVDGEEFLWIARGANRVGRGGGAAGVEGGAGVVGECVEEECRRCACAHGGSASGDG